MRSRRILTLAAAICLLLPTAATAGCIICFHPTWKDRHWWTKDGPKCQSWWRTCNGHKNPGYSPRSKPSNGFRSYFTCHKGRKAHVHSWLYKGRRYWHYHFHKTQTYGENHFGNPPARISC